MNPAMPRMIYWPCNERDGGWAELPHMPPDAYSTGEALVALHEAGGVAVTDSAWQKGLHYLLSTQQPDGSWHVHTRQLSPAAVSPSYFESGFPYGHDQYLSTAATCWAAMALMLTLPKAVNPPAPQAPAILSPTGLKPWMETALFGTAAELKAKLDAGLDPNSQTPEGTTLLMMAASDAEKVQLLIDRGADVHAKAKSGFTALMVATTYFGTSPSVKLLLEHGAEANPGKGVMFDASPLFLAALAGDRDNIALLLAKGADPNRKMDLDRDVPHQSPVRSSWIRRSRGHPSAAQRRSECPREGFGQHDGATLGRGGPPPGGGEDAAGSRGGRECGGSLRLYSAPLRRNH